MYNKVDEMLDNELIKILVEETVEKGSDRLLDLKYSSSQ